jgi:hypothetical protein
MAKRAKPVLGSLSWSLILVVYFVFPEAGGGVLPESRPSLRLQSGTLVTKYSIWQCIMRLPVVDHVE